MDDARLGSTLRTLRIRRRWRQEDVAVRAGVSRSFVSLLERGHVDAASVHALRSVCAALDVRLDLVPRWRAGDLDRVLNARHGALHESFGSYVAAQPGWEHVPEVSFAVYGERGVIDILAWHAGCRAVALIELKTDIADPQEVVGTLDRKRRLVRRIARDRGWDPLVVGTWLVITEGSTNRRRVAAHRTLFTAALSGDTRTFRAWLAVPTASASGVVFWADDNGSSARQRLVTPRRIRNPDLTGSGP